MTAVSGGNFRSGEAYWELSGPLPLNRISTCRACKQSILKGDLAMARDGRKLRFVYHEACFTGDADPRSQENSSFHQRKDLHAKTAPRVSSLEGPRACRDPDGRPLGREVFKPTAPSTVGTGKWSVASRGYKPSPESLLSLATTHSGLTQSQGSHTTSAKKEGIGRTPAKK